MRVWPVSVGAEVSLVVPGWRRWGWRCQHHHRWAVVHLARVGLPLVRERYFHLRRHRR